MSIQSPSPRRHRATTRVLATALACALVINGCTEKEADFFTALGDLPTLGSIDVFVNGPPAGAAVQLTGPGFSDSRTIGESGFTFQSLALGSYTATVTEPAGYACTQLTQTRTLTDAAPNASLTFDCPVIAPDPATLRFTTTGLTGSTTFPLTITGQASLSGNLGPAGLTFTGLGAGSYTYGLDLGTTPMYDCSPATGSVTLTAGQDLTVPITCAFLPGAATVSVTGLGGGTAAVAWTGPSPGSNVFGASPTTIPDLTMGSYTFTITDPTGFDCGVSPQAVTITPGATTAVTFDCTPIATQPLTVGVQLSGIQGSPGAVPIGSYPVNLLDGGSPVGTTTIQALGGNTFIGFTPDRLGLGNGGAYRFDLGVNVGGQPFNVTGFAICTVNGAVSAGNPLVVTFLNQAEAVTGTENVTTVPTCAWMVVPANTRYAHVTWPNAGFVDFNGIQYWRP